MHNLHHRSVEVKIKKKSKKLPLIKIIRWDYDPGDERSYARLAFNAQTPCGVVNFESMIDSNSDLFGDEWTWKVDGVEIDTKDDGSLDDIIEITEGPWHYFAGGMTDVKAKRLVIAGLMEWCKHQTGATNEAS